MQLIPIPQTIAENGEFLAHPLCSDSLQAVVDYYTRIGFNKPWIGYYAQLDGQMVGSAAFKGKPVNGQVEIAYSTFEPYRGQGIGTAICRQLVELSLKTDKTVRITARTLPAPNHSTSILAKNDFKYLGIVLDPEDGEVWEWGYMGSEAGR